MDRVAVVQHLERIRGNVALATYFLAREDDMTATVELLGRLNIIESEVATIRKTLAGLPGRSSNVTKLHTTGDRPDAA